ncbi:MAG: 3-oxoacyl-ACP reductase FabG [Ardenticatenaceae bacterium]|nr:3-oxoacyl-ACP reductase FabG [Ardenticatenaceae bacterium]
MRLTDKVALVTGGGSGIGEACVMRFAAAGAAVAVNDVNVEGAERVAGAVRANGGQALVVPANVTSPGEVDAMVAEVLREFGRLDILINNAGVNRDALAVRKTREGEIKKMSPQQWDFVIDVNLKGTFLCAQAAAVPMMEQKSGCINNTASIGALGNIGQANYSASKAGVIGLTKTLALELARYGIRVNAVAPGATATQMTAGIPDTIREALIQKIPLRRMADPGEIAAAHLFLASDDAAYITGQVLFVDGGITVGI